MSDSVTDNTAGQTWMADKTSLKTVFKQHINQAGQSRQEDPTPRTEIRPAKQQQAQNSIFRSAVPADGAALGSDDNAGTLRSRSLYHHGNPGVCRRSVQTREIKVAGTGH